MGVKQGLETVIDAAAQLADGTIVVTLVGDGNRRLDLLARVAALKLTNVRFLPLQDDFPRTLAAADMLVLAQGSSVVDSVAPSKLLSYMASGKPIVATVNDASEAARMIRRANCGIVVPPQDPVALATAVRKLQHEPKTRTLLGKAGRAHAAERYEMANVLGEWSKLVNGQPSGHSRS
jgi:glycosyltransferase involved in cell wall biosynthesis